MRDFLAAVRDHVVVFDGSMGEYVARAIQSRKPSVAELEELEAMIAEAKKRARGRDEEGRSI